MNLLIQRFPLIQTKSATLVFALILMAASSLSAQSTSDGQNFSNLKTVVWKNTTDFTTIMTAEQNRMNTELAQPTISVTDKCLFLAYKRLLTYLETDVQANVPVADALIKSYDRVVAEVPNDNNLKQMPTGALAGFLSNLVEILQPTPTPVLNPKF